MKKIFFTLFIIITGCSSREIQTPVPEIVSISPISGGAGTVVTITGKNFSSMMADNKVTINDVAASINTASSTTLEVVVPNHAGTGQVKVSVSGGTAVGDVFTYQDIFLSGWGTNSSATQAAVWTNGSPNFFADGWIGYSVFADGNDVYVAGVESNTKRIAKYWKNGVAVTLSDGLQDAEAFSIAVSGGDVYVAGYEGNSNNISIATYWKNGVAHPLTDGTNFAEAGDVFIDGNDIYVCGQESFSGHTKAYVWKNDTAIPLNDGSTAVYPVSIFVSAGDIYVAGFETNANNVHVAKFWKNGTPFPLTDGTHAAEGFSIAVQGGDVFVAGQEKNTAGYMVAKYWKNGVQTILADGSQNSVSNCIVVRNDDVYVSGQMGTAAVYWKNGSAVVVRDPGFVFSIFIQ